MKKKLVNAIACIAILVTMTMLLVACGVTITDSAKVYDYISNIKTNNFTIEYSQGNIIVTTMIDDRLKCQIVPTGKEEVNEYSKIEDTEGFTYRFDKATSKWIEEKMSVHQFKAYKTIYDDGSYVKIILFPPPYSNDVDVAESNVAEFTEAYFAKCFVYDNTAKLFKGTVGKKYEGYTFSIIKGVITLTKGTGETAESIAIKDIGKTKVTLPKVG